MARKSNINTKISKIEEEIAKTTEKLNGLTKQHKELLAEKQQEELKKLKDLLVEKGLTIDSAMDIIVNSTKEHP